MNPPIKDIADKNALIEGILDGTVDMIATDHAPHSAEEKSRGFCEEHPKRNRLDLSVLFRLFTRTWLRPVSYRLST